jgi:hypothetical protein
MQKLMTRSHNVDHKDNKMNFSVTLQSQITELPLRCFVEENALRHVPREICLIAPTLGESAILSNSKESLQILRLNKTLVVKFIFISNLECTFLLGKKYNQC